jgi:hypothetical protein
MSSDNKSSQCFARMTKKKFKIHSSIIYSEKRCQRECAPGQRRCHECLLRPAGPTRHGNQEGRQVDQGDVDGDYPPWSAIFGSPRYFNLIEKYGHIEELDIINDLRCSQIEARHGIIPKTDDYMFYKKENIMARRPKNTAAAAAATTTATPEQTHHSLIDIIRQPQYYANSRTPYLVQNVIHITRDDLIKMLKEDSVRCNSFDITK